MISTHSTDTLDAVKGKTGRICPLICEHGFKADGDRCSKITCRAGYEVGDDNTCEKTEGRKPTAKRNSSKQARPEQPALSRARESTSAPSPARQGTPFNQGTGCTGVAY